MHARTHECTWSACLQRGSGIRAPHLLCILGLGRERARELADVAVTYFWHFFKLPLYCVERRYNASHRSMLRLHEAVVPGIGLKLEYDRETRNGVYVGGGLDWLTPFSIFTGISVVVLYAALGCGWLIYKTGDDLQDRMFKLMPKLIIALLIILGAVSIYTPLTHPQIAERWFSQPQFTYFMPVPVLVLLFTWLALRACKRRSELGPFTYMLVLVFLAYTGFLISLWPYIIPPSVTIWQAAAHENSQLFALIGALILIPIIVIYTGMSYWVFRHKVRVGDDGYH